MICGRLAGTCRCQLFLITWHMALMGICHVRFHCAATARLLVVMINAFIAFHLRDLLSSDVILFLHYNILT